MVADDVLLELIHSELVAYAYNKEEEKDKKEVDFSSLEYAGFLSGYRIIERLTKDWPRFKDELETLKFICTDFWSSVYKKQIDNLRTNHQGVYVLQDNAFRFLSRISSGTQYLEHAPRYVAFTCGLLRGALANLGIVSLVTAEIQPMPAVKFHIEVKRS
ncbi:trafficking protein particle complex subunit 6b isoform X2 [Homalodisca vitripennis]|uniref:Trafficking protein particle complex subunit 6B n=1 Tax=Homalodisca liturata TaxID=320908 RepID=A0A1B6JC29_9HEMI|nr:trafficking protein particle complex subunit 6b isoform X2 [Homalodisca vitripennis]